MTWIWIALLVALVLLLVGALGLLLSPGYKVEVQPGTALICKNLWKGEPFCLLPGTEFIRPGIDRKLEEVTLRNEAENPSDAKLITGDGVELQVDYIVRRLQIGYPGMPLELDDPALDEERLKAAAIKAVIVINYSGRRDAVLTRMIAALQASLEKRRFSDLFLNADLEKGDPGKVNIELMKEIEDEVNECLLKDIVTAEWGFVVEVDVEDMNLPPVLKQALARKAGAKVAGQAIGEKAQEAGVDPWVIAIAEAFADILHRPKGDQDQ